MVMFLPAILFLTWERYFCGSRKIRNMCRVSVHFSALYAKTLYYLVTCMQSVDHNTSSHKVLTTTRPGTKFWPSSHTCAQARTTRHCAPSTPRSPRRTSLPCGTSLTPHNRSHHIKYHIWCVKFTCHRVFYMVWPKNIMVTLVSTATPVLN